jgi:hypothetical protein
MSPKTNMLVAGTTIWMYAALTCAALPVVYAVPQLKSIGPMAPFVAALIAGALVGVPLSIAARRLCCFGSSKIKKTFWATFTAREAMLFGIIYWGVPVGLIFTIYEFLQSQNPFGVAMAVVVWPLAGAAFGLIMRLLRQWHDGSQTA